MANNPLHVAIAGCGGIAGPYARTLVAAPQVELCGVTDIEPQKAAKLAAESGCYAYPSLEALLADARVELVVNLTTHHAHYAVTTQCLEGGKHVYSEKPLALTTEEAWQLVDLARARGLRLGCSPFTWLGAAQQAAWQQIRAGRLGTVRVAYAEVNWGRIETWHPAPQAFYEVGALFDVGVYPLTLLTAIFGPARRVWAYGQRLHPDRVTKHGVPFHIETPDFAVVIVEWEGGPVARLTTNFYVSQQTQQKSIEFHGDAASLSLSSWQEPGATVEIADYDQPYQPVPIAPGAPGGVQWGHGVLEMAAAMAAGRPHPTTGEQAAHVVEILCAATKAMATHQPVSLASTFTPPTPQEEVA